MTATLTALMGSSDKAKKTMSWLENFGAKSVFEQAPLQEATTRLEAFGLTATKWLPTISNLAAAFGTDGENLLELSDALGRLKAGQSGEALEALRRFGIGSDILKAKGITFDGGGQMATNANTALAAIEQIIKEKFGRINDIMGNTLAVKMSNLGDSWQRILRLTGDVFSPALKTLIDKLGDTMNYIASSGIATQLAQGFEKLINPDKIVSGFRVGVSWLLAGLDGMPKLLKSLGEFGSDFQHTLMFFLTKLSDEHLWDYYGSVISKSMQRNMPTVLSGVLRSANILLADFEISMLKAIGFGKNSFTIQQLEKAKAASMKGLGETLQVKNPLDINAPEFDKVKATYKNVSDIFASIGNVQKSYLSKLIGDNQTSANNDKVKDSTTTAQQPISLLGQIASNTSKTAENTKKQIEDLRRYVVGGGSLEGAGVTPVGLYGQARGRSISIQQSAIHSSAVEFVRSVVLQMQHDEMLKPRFS